MKKKIRFITIDDKKWFDQIFEKSVAANLGNEYLSQIIQEPYFVNFLRDDIELNEEDIINNSVKQVESSEKKIYEEVIFLEI